MSRILIAVAAILVAVSVVAAPAQAYKRDVPREPSAGQEEAPLPQPQHAPDEGQQETREREDEGMGAPPNGRGTVIGGYVLLTIGGLAAIGGSTMIAAMNNDTWGIIVSSSGAALSLGGTLMILLGQGSGYALGPQIDPAHQHYGLVLAKKF